MIAAAREADGDCPVDAIIFLAPLVFTQVLQEDPSVNRVEDSIYIWKKVCKNDLLSRTTIILFLNKIDVFKAKLPKVPLEKYFNDYAGGPDVNKAAKYILWRFMQVNRARLSIYPQYVVSQ